jgi:2-oxoglutarate ferredoxin oxidoreductase subunit beta
VHDPSHPDPSLSFALSRLSSGPYEPTPVGVFRSVRRPEYASEASRQLAAAHEARGPGDLGALLQSRPTWTVQ